jgi:pyridoxine 5-phosphate synthase
MRLGINIDHVATIRNARGSIHPDPLRAAKIAEKAGADGITAHLREDRRHISDQDIKALKDNITVPLNLEMAATEEMLEIALDARPERVCIVPEKRLEVTTEGGLELSNISDNKKLIICDIINQCFKFNIDVSLFIDPDIKQIEAAINLGVKIIELHTGEYCNSHDKQKELNRIQYATMFAVKNNIEVHAGHGLDFDNVVEIAKIREIKELNIGHFLIGESIFMGLESVIKNMRNIIDTYR